jgi:hypothetical protein
MSVLNGAHARLFNRRHARRGPLFEARYFDEPVGRNAHFTSVIRYVALNPVEAGLVRRPQDWPWSTYPQLIGLAPPWPGFEPAVVLEHFGSVRRLRTFVELPGTEVPGKGNVRD